MLQSSCRAGLLAASIAILSLIAACGTHTSARLSAVDLGTDQSQALNHLLDDYLTFSGEPGVALAIETGARNYQGAAGLRDLATGQAMTPTTQFRIGSGTKLFIITLAMKLHERGLLGLDDPLGKYVEQFPKWSAITIRQLAAMRSGIPDYLFDKTLWAAVTLQPRKVRTPQSLLAFVQNQPLLAPPGTSCRYSNTNYLLLGMVIEKITGRPVDELIQTQLLGPLGLAGTVFDKQGDPLPALAHGYVKTDAISDAFGLPRFLAPVVFSLQRVNGLADMTYRYHPSISSTAGSIVSTPVDVARFIDHLFKGDVLSSASMATLKETQACVILGKPFDYGVGLLRLPSELGDLYGHNSLSYGYRTRSFHAEAAGFSFSLMTNRVPDQGDALQDEILRTLATTPAPARSSACAVPADWQTPQSGDHLKLRFRGRINSENAAALAHGIGSGDVRIGGRNYPLDGAYFSARQAGADVVIATASAPRYEHVHSRDLRISVHLNLPAMQETMVQGRGRYAFTVRDEDAPVVLVRDYTHVGDQQKACVIAIAHGQRSSAVDICAAPAQPSAFAFDLEQVRASSSDPEMIKLFATLALETRSKVIKDYLVSQAIPACECRGRDGVAVACD